MIVSIFLVFVLSSFVALHIASRSSKSAKLIDKIPGPSPLPFIGNGLMLNGSPEKTWDLICQLIHDYYPLVRIWIFNISVLLISHPDHMKVVLSSKKNQDKCKKLVFNGIKAVGNEGIVVSGGEKWHQRRKLILPAFNPDMMKVYVEIMNEHFIRLLEDIKQNKLGPELDLVPTFKKSTLGVICEAAMGVDPSSLGVKKEEQFRHGFNELMQIILYRATRPYIHDWMMKFLIVGRTQDSAVALFRNFCETIIKERREYHKRYPKLPNVVEEIDDAETATNQPRRLALIDLLLNAEKEGSIDAKGISEEVETVMAAGYDTSGLVLTFALMLLADNKAEQDLARAEATQILEKTGGVLKMADINSLNYLDRCIKETLRLYPGVPITGRHITEKIKLGDYEIPEGTEVLPNFFQLHRDPNYWPDPEKFDPDRFLPENSKERHPFAYLPFGTGPRYCIGNKFAMLEVKVAVARILYDFYIEPVDSLVNVGFKMHVTLMPKVPCRVKLVEIDRKSGA